MRRPVRALTLTAAAGIFAAMAFGVTGAIASGAAPAAGGGTTTPIQHVVVIFDENISFDHYFGTYPFAANAAGEPAFTAKAGTPMVNGLYAGLDASGQPTGPLLTNNPNLSNPQRLGHNDPMTCDQDHGYTHEQSADDLGAMDKFVQDTGKGATIAQCLAGLTYSGSPEPVPAGSPNYAVMDYYDGNSVTGLWNYAQQYAMSDAAYTTNYGPSTPGALNVTSAQTYGAICGPTSATINDGTCTAPAGLQSPATNTTSMTIPASQDPGAGTDYSDADPTYDICTYLPSADGGDNRGPASTITMGGPNIGTELNTAGVTWGWFEGGFDNGYVPGTGMTQPTTAEICNERHSNVGGNSVVDYIPHHQPFEYYASTANPMHLPPTSVAAIGHQDQANHQYDLADFWAAANSGNLPQVSFLKAGAYQDGHGGYSDPLDEQNFLVDTINHLESLPTWKSTAVVVTYDDSDGWYDHVFPTIRSASQTALDTLTGPGMCGTAPVPVNTAGQPEQGRCGLGIRIPFLVVSPWAKSNVVTSNVIDTSSVVKFIEQNWGLPSLGNGAADAKAGSIMPMFDFNSKTPPNGSLFLDQNGEPTS
jgi:phospholipase C